MTDTLYYWPLPFRGSFVLYATAWAGAELRWTGFEQVAALKSKAVGDQPIPFMAPPLYHDADAELWVSQLPAILMHVGGKFGLLPDSLSDRTRTLKLICDANDVSEEMTCNCGRTMWTQEAWDDFAATRLPRWMQVFEDTARRSGMTAQGGTMLGTDTIGMADLATAALWSTATTCLPALRPLLDRHAPKVAAHCDRITATPRIRTALDQRAPIWGDAWCGGQIEASIRAALAGWPGPNT